LDLIDKLLRNAKIPYMLVGATARDLLLYHVFGHAVTRATYDLDFAVLVDSWEQFAIVKQLFLNIPGFTDRGRSAQRLYYQPTGASFETIIDIIPFGKLETADRTIEWPSSSPLPSAAILLAPTATGSSASPHSSIGSILPATQ
jgi:predicted nucleotidyltransferase